MVYPMARGESSKGRLSRPSVGLPHPSFPFRPLLLLVSAGPQEARLLWGIVLLLLQKPADFCPSHLHANAISGHDRL